MYVNVVSITPEHAEDLLKGNTRNRKLNQALVDDYSRDMAAGRWQLNGEAIKLSDSGTLLDGQHRLAGIVKSGATVPMLVITGLPEDAQTTMDTGRKRSMGDMLTLEGELYARNLAAVARRACQWDQGNHRFASHPNPTPAEIRATLEKYPTLRRSAEMGQRIANGFRPAKAAVSGTAHHLFLRIDPDLTAEFFAQLETGADLGQGHPVLVLRNRLTQDRITQRVIQFHQGIAAFIRVWNAIRENEELTILKVPADLKMPMPV